MPGPVTYSTIALLARDRLHQLNRMLASKRDNARRVGGAPVFNDIDKQIKYLAGRAHRMMSGAPSVPAQLRLYGPPLGDEASKFLFMGAIGPEFTAFAAQNAPLRRWLRDTLHNGTPDEYHRQIVSYSTDFIIALARDLRARIAADYGDENERRAVEQKMQAYVLGHCCHIAADVVTAPYIGALESRFGGGGWTKVSRWQIIRALEEEVARRVFGSPAGVVPNLSDWWPMPEQVPRQFYRAFVHAVEQVYGPQGRRSGAGPFEAARARHAPPELTERLIVDGYRSFRIALHAGSVWTWPEWLGVTAGMFLPALVALPLAAALPAGRDLFRDSKPPGYDNDAALFEAFTFPFAVTSLVPLVYSVIFGLSPIGAEGPTVATIVSGAVQVLAAIIFFATLGVGGGDAAKWALLFILPIVLEIAITVYSASEAGVDAPQRKSKTLAAIVHLALSSVFLLLFCAFLHFAVEALQDGDLGAFVGIFFIWLVIVGGLWVGTAGIMRECLSDPEPVSPEALPVGVASGDLMHNFHVELFDDATLYAYAATGAAPPLPAARFFPPGARPILKIWWEGAGAPTVVASHDRLEFRFGAAATVTVNAPTAPMKLSEFRDLLMRTVRNGAVAGLHAAFAFPDHPELEDYVLPPGKLFLDHGDDRLTQADHDAHVGDERAVGASEAQAYRLLHAPRYAQAVRFGRSGPIDTESVHTAAVAGVGVLTTNAGNPRQLTVSGPNATRLTRLFRAGDVVEAPGAGPQRVVVSVDSDTQITVATPFPAPLAGSAFGRAARNRRQQQAAPAGWQVQSRSGFPLVLDGVGGIDFGQIFRPGDRILVDPGGTGQVRLVVNITSATEIRINRPLEGAFAPPVAPAGGGAAAPTPAGFARVGDEDAELYGFLADPDDNIFRGKAVMNEAADLAVLLCLGATTHLLSDAERRDRVAMDHAAADVNPVYQVFRNWNLDRRRENEWKMLVLGGAVSEKAGNPADPDFAMGTPPAGWSSPASAGEPLANKLGWIPLLRGWLDMAGRPETDSRSGRPFRPDAAPNADMSKAMAFLLDMADPGRVN